MAKRLFYRRKLLCTQTGDSNLDVWRRYFCNFVVVIFVPLHGYRTAAICSVCTPHTNISHNSRYTFTAIIHSKVLSRAAKAHRAALSPFSVAISQSDTYRHGIDQFILSTVLRQKWMLTKQYKAQWRATRKANCSSQLVAQISTKFYTK